nr:amblin-like isoform X4 [Dermacentor andersoni]
MKCLATLLLFFRLIFVQAFFRKPQVKNATVPLICHMSPYDGNDCRAAGDLWYYDLANKSCKMLTTGSCSSGSNRFHTIAKCQQICEPQRAPKPFCSQQPVSTFCTGQANHWYFDENKNTCLVFLKKRCGKPNNRFNTFAQCMNRCSYVTS